MSTSKKKVQFSEKKTYQKYARQEDSDDSDDDGSNDNEAAATSSTASVTKKAKHSLDSDEEDNTDKYELLNRSAFNEIGQEAKTSEFDDDIKLTPFNMKDELEEGDFDRDGYYHWKKDKDPLKDAWLDNIDWANVNSFKKTKEAGNNKSSGATATATSSGMDVDGGEADSDNEGKIGKGSDDDDESDSDESGRSNDDEASQLSMLKQIVALLRPGETTLSAIKRLGKTASSNSSASSTLSASQRWLKKKQQPQPKASSQADSATPASEEQAKADKAAIEKLTGCANHFIDQGFYGIYEETLEKLNKRIAAMEKSGGGKGAASAFQTVSSFDIFADDLDDSAISAATAATAAAQPSTSKQNNEDSKFDDTVVKWVYKTENTDESPLHGPFTSQKMLEMAEKGEFKESGVWCRKVDDSSSSADTTFYNSKRIDFDLYS